MMPLAVPLCCTVDMHCTIEDSYLHLFSRFVVLLYLMVSIIFSILLNFFSLRGLWLFVVLFYLMVNIFFFDIIKLFSLRGSWLFVAWCKRLCIALVQMHVVPVVRGRVV